MKTVEIKFKEAKLEVEYNYNGAESGDYYTPSYSHSVDVEKVTIGGQDVTLLLDVFMEEIEEQILEEFYT